MARTFHQIYIQIVFSVKHRAHLIPSEHKEELHKYITGVVQNNKCKMIAINSMPDHIHIFIGLHPTIAISDLVKTIKTSSNDLINDNHWLNNKFYWQDGFGVFSYGKSQVNNVYDYIMNQEEHHKKYTFHEEYFLFLKKYEIKYDFRYVFDLDD